MMNKQTNHSSARTRDSSGEVNPPLNTYQKLLKGCGEIESLGRNKCSEDNLCEECDLKLKYYLKGLNECDKKVEQFIKELKETGKKIILSYYDKKMNFVDFEDLIDKKAGEKFK